MLFPLFFLLFKEQKKMGHLSVFSIRYSPCFLCDFSSTSEDAAEYKRRVRQQAKQYPPLVGY